MEERQWSLSYDYLSDKGERSVNEDSVGMTEEQGKLLFVLCDGLGGHGGGDVASALVVEKMKERFARAGHFEDCITHAQQALLEKQKQPGVPGGMRTTVVCLGMNGTIARFAHVGDSRGYFFENGKFRFRTIDHSVPQMLALRGEIRDEEIRRHEDRSRLLRVLGEPWDEPRYQLGESIPLAPGASFLLCSDGFWEWIDEADMERTLQQAPTPAIWLAEMEHLVCGAGQGKQMDNYSAIAVFVR